MLCRKIKTRHLKTPAHDLKLSAQSCLNKQSYVCKDLSPPWPKIAQKCGSNHSFWNSQHNMWPTCSLFSPTYPLHYMTKTVGFKVFWVVWMRIRWRHREDKNELRVDDPFTYNTLKAQGRETYTLLTEEDAIILQNVVWILGISYDHTLC